MVEQARFDEILEEVEKLEILRNFRRVRVTNSGAVVQGETDIEGHPITLEIELGPSFPLELPRFMLRPWNALGYIPHVAPDGTVCFLDPEGVLLDRRRPEYVVAEAFDRVVHILSEGVTGENHDDFMDEFAACWRYLNGSYEARSSLDPSDNLGHAFVGVGPQRLWVASSRRELEADPHRLKIPPGLAIRSALYLPLQPGTVVIPPRADRPFWSADDARAALLPGVSEANRARLRKLIHPLARDLEYLVVKLPRPSGGESFFGIRYEGVSERHPLHLEGRAERLVPIRIEREDRALLIGRGGGDVALGTKHVLLVGCGAVGGHLAFALARLGVLSLTLVDPDELKSENTFRHVLGMEYRGRTKVAALKEAIETQLPYVRVAAIAAPIQEALDTGAINLARFDLVALATGNPTIELMVNGQLHRLEKGPPAVIAWLEPLGIGGHVLLTNNGSQTGCLECLYTTPEGEWDGANRAAFADAEQDQSFGRAWDGCGSLHTPFGSIDAEQTAVLGARLAIETLTGKETGNPLVSWKGDASAFTAAGFRLSARYAFSAEELYRQRYAYRGARCPICGDACARVVA